MAVFRFCIFHSINFWGVYFPFLKYTSILRVGFFCHFPGCAFSILPYSRLCKYHFEFSRVSKFQVKHFKHCIVFHFSVCDFFAFFQGSHFQFCHFPWCGSILSINSVCFFCHFSLYDFCHFLGCEFSNFKF